MCSLHHKKMRENINKVGVIVVFLSIALFLSSFLGANDFFGFNIETYQIGVVTTLLILGSFGFLYRQDHIILTTIPMCMLVVYLSKDQSSLNKQSVQVQDLFKVVHLKLNSDDTQDTFEYDLKHIDADLISIYKPSSYQITNLNIAYLKQRYSHFHNASFETGEQIMIFSNERMKNIETINDAGTNMCVAGKIYITKLQQEISFISFRDFRILRKNESYQPQFLSLGEYLDDKCLEGPVFAFGDTQLSTINPALKLQDMNFKFKDSQFINPNSLRDEHIFFSGDMKCLNYAEIFNGRGIFAVYRFPRSKAFTLN